MNRKPGLLSYIILNLAKNKGTVCAQDVVDFILTEDSIRPVRNTIHTYLNDLEDHGLLMFLWVPAKTKPKKLYTLTASGRTILGSLNFIVKYALDYLRVD